MHKIGQNKYCHITHEWTQYTFHHLRDFSWTKEDYSQEEHWITDTYDVSKITSIEMIIIPFGMHKLLAHTMLIFHFSDKRELGISVEAQLEQGKEYGMMKAIFLWYYNLYIWGTAKDLLWLRKIRKEKAYGYPLHLDTDKIQKLFVALTHKTNDAHKKHERYALLWNNCTSGLWNVARRFFSLPSRHWTLFLVPRIPYFLKKKWALKLTEREIM